MQPLAGRRGHLRCHQADPGSEPLYLPRLRISLSIHLCSICPWVIRLIRAGLIRVSAVHPSLIHARLIRPCPIHPRRPALPGGIPVVEHNTSQ
jgi:hypothetical protein